MKKSLLCFYITCLFFLPTNPATATHWTRKNNVISIGVVTENPIEKYSSFKEFSEYLAFYLADLGITSGRPVLVSTLNEGIKLVRDGVIDIISETAYSSFILIKKAEMTPILLGLRDGVKEYGSFLIIKKDSGIRNVAELLGKKITFEDRHSTAAYILPRLYIESQGVKLFFVPFIRHPQRPLPPGYVAYDFMCNELDSIRAVIDGTVDACAIKSTLWEKHGKIPSTLKDQLKILAKTDPVPRSFVLCSSVLSEDIKERIICTLTKSKNIPVIYKTRQYQRLEPQEIKYLKGFDSLLD